MTNSHSMMAGIPAAIARQSRTAATLLAAILSSASAMADDEEASDRQSRDGASTLKAVTVTGSADQSTEGSGSYTSHAPVSASTKLRLSARETPQSISVVTRERIDDMGLQTLSETMQATTGIFVNANDTERVTYNARGYAVTNFQVDGMLNTFGGYLKTNGDNVVYDRIEIVRGATGLTTGAGDPSATINQIRKRPTMEFQGSTALRFGDFNLRRAEIDLSGPIAFDGKVRARVVAAKQDANSFRPMYKENRDVFYGIVETDLGPNTVASFGFEQQKSNPRGVTWATLPYWNANGTVADLPFGLNLSTPWATWSMDERKTFVSLEHRLNDDWRVRTALTHSDRIQDGRLYFGYVGYPRADRSGISAGYGRFPSTEEMNAIDINVDGRFQLLGRSHEIVFGWGNSKLRSEAQGVNVPPLPTTYSSIPDWNAWTGAVPEFPSFVQPFPQSASKIKQSAGYAATRLSFTESLKAVVGMRFGTFETDTQNFSSVGSPTTRSGFKKKSVLTPYAGLLYELNSDWTVYGSYTDIFQPQAFRDSRNEYLDPVVGKSYEAGIKGAILGSRLNVNAAIFRSQKDNIAEIDDAVTPNSLPGGIQAYRSTGKGNVVDGIELEAVGKLSPQWNVFSGYTYTRSRDANGVANNTPVPRTLLRVFSTYKMSGSLAGLSVGGGLSLQSSFWSAAQQPTGATTSKGVAITVPSRIVQRGVALFSLMASYQINDHLTANLNINNIFNKHYYSRVGFYNGVHYAEPRTISLAIRANF